MLQYFKYHIPFKKPFIVSGNEITYREGIILHFREGNIEAYGEVAPLPGFSTETLAEVEEVLKVNKKHLQQSIQDGNGKEVLKVLNQTHQFPSLSFGLDTLLHDLAAKRTRTSLVQYLFPSFSGSILTNATIPIQNKMETLAAAKKYIDAGFQTLKLKVGRDFSVESKIIKQLRTQFPRIKIRIDANEAWTKKEAIQNLKALEALNIEYCEQPVSRENLSDLKEVKEAVKIPVAADEFIRNINDVNKIIEKKATNLLIIKPMLMGTFNNIFVTKEVADTHNIELIFTTLFETAVGRAAIAAITAGLCGEYRAQGLA
ncbi:MAG: o-succinylbenzoate synthase, partial [Balneolaceae bacterium]